MSIFYSDRYLPESFGAVRDKHNVAAHLDDNVFFGDLNEAIIILKPLTDWIAVCEIASGSLAEAMESLLEVAKTLLRSDLEKEFLLAGVKAFLHYLHPDKLTKEELSIMIAANALDIRHSMN